MTMPESDYVAAIRQQVVQELAALQARIPQEPKRVTRQPQSKEAVFDEFKYAAQARLTAMADFLDLFDRSQDLQVLLGDLIGQRVLDTEQRLLDKLEEQTQQTAHIHAEMERAQRRENIAISLISLLAGWFISLAGTPLTLFSHFVR